VQNATNMARQSDCVQKYAATTNQMDTFMNSKILSLSLAVGSGLLFASHALAQGAAAKLEFPAPSPGCTIKQRVGLTDVEVTYSRPSAKGREIFGGVVPFDKVWRTGANQATKVVFSTDVKLNGTNVSAGTYALMTIPAKDEWTIIINKPAEQGGPFKYDEKNDVVRFKAKPVKVARALETFTIEFNDIHEDSSLINLSWDKTEVPIKLEVVFVEKLLAQIESVMASDAKDKPYFQAAAFYLNHGQDLKKAKEWIEIALKERDAYYMVFVKAQILNKLGDKEGAIAASKHSTELAEKANDGAYVRLNAEFMSKLK
jgi:hypothetical protein